MPKTSSIRYNARMCAQYIIKGNLHDLEKKYGIPVPEDINDDINQRVLPYQPGLVILKSGQNIKFANMSYSLIPAWSKQSKVKFATHNARCEGIAHKPTWRIPFLNQRCAVPLSHFIEPIYHNDHAGYMVRFHEKHQGLLLAAGLWDHWQDRATKSTLNSFAIVTDEPDSFVKEVGHDRMPIFLTQQGVEHWLDPQQHDPAKLLQTLKEQKALVEWAVDRDRPMKAGWERRV